MDGALTSAAEVTTTPARKANSSAACAQAALLGAVASGTVRIYRSVNAASTLRMTLFKYCVAIRLHEATASGPHIILH